MRARSYQLRNPFSDPVKPAQPVSEPAGMVAAPAGPAEGRALTVTELTRQIKGILQGSFPVVWVEGELFEPKVYPSGHLWFDLKDAQSTIKGVMWRDEAALLKFQPEHGLKVVIRGHLDFYSQRGELKLVAETLEPKGVGALQLAFEQLKEKLQKEGLFDEARKRSLPAFPESVGLVTSPRGAAVDDILKVLRGSVRILLYPARVQGAGAAAAIAHGIRELNSAGEDLDLLIVGRGGGSLEDLWAFNEEPVARAIFSSELPVISAVGHEKDVTISDLVADLRAPTPTRAAEIVAGRRRLCLERLAAVLEEPAFVEPEESLGEYRERIEDLEQGMAEGLQAPLLERAHGLRLLHEQLLRCSPQALILHQAQRIHALAQTLAAGMTHRLARWADEVHGLAGRLNALSPLAVLERGYSITFDAQGRILKEALGVQPGEVIQTRLHRGSLRSRVENIQRHPEAEGRGISL